MEHYYIGCEEEKLYSVYHEPRFSENNSKAVVLCYPVGQEYIRCHRMYSNLAGKLANEGVHVVRFDYYGTGDSYGEFSSATLSQWVSNIKEVAEELKTGTGAEKLYIVGVRMGGSLALRYAGEEPVDGLVLLSPVVDGKTFLDEVSKDYNTWLNGSFAKKGKVRKDQMECHGFLYSRELKTAIRNISPDTISFPRQIPTLLIDERQTLDPLVFNITDNKAFTFSRLLNKDLWKKKKGEEDKDILPIHEINLISDWIARI